MRAENETGRAGRLPVPKLRLSGFNFFGNERFAGPVLNVFLTVFGIAIGVLATGSVVSELKNLTQDQERLIGATKRLILHERDFGTQTLKEIAQNIGASDALRHALENRDQHEVAALSRKLLAEHSGNGAIQLSIFPASERLEHNNGAFAGTVFDRHVFQSTMKKDLFGWSEGVELDQGNQVVVSVLTPLIADENLLGYMRLSLDIERSLALASATAGAQIIKICVLDAAPTSITGQQRYKVIGGPVLPGFEYSVIETATAGNNALDRFYLRGKSVFLVRPLPIALSNTGPEARLILVKDVTSDVWSFITSAVMTLLAAAGLGFVAWTIVHRILFTAQSSVDVVQMRLQADAAQNSEKLEHKTAQLAEAQRVASIGSWERDIVTNEIQASEEFFRILDVPSDSDGDTILTLTRQNLPKEDLKLAHSQISHAIATCGTFEFEHRYQKDGAPEKHLHVRGYVVAGADGKAKRLFGILHDVTCQRLAERQNSLFAEVLDASLNEIYLINADTLKIEYANRCALTNLGYSDKDLLGQTFCAINLLHSPDPLCEQLAPLQSGQDDSFASEATHTRQDGSSYPVDMKIRLHEDRERRLFVAIAADASQRIQRESETLEAKIRAERLAYFDPLTQLPNRAACQRDALERFADANKPAFLIHLDIDGFKKVNDTLGHVAGDSCLQETGSRLQKLCDGLATAYRWGGDEFVILAEDDSSDVNALCKRARQVMRAPMEFNGQRFWPTVSMGIALCPKDGSDFETLLMNADVALYQSKTNGKNRNTFFDRSMTSDSEKEARIEQELREAVSQNQFTLLFQPQVNLRSHNVTGIEALLRWQHPEQGELSPAAFLPVVEKTNLAPVIGELVIDKALEAARSWLDAGLNFGRMSINVSQGHLASGQLAEHFKSAMKKHRIGPEHLTAEVLESVFLSNRASDDLSAISELYELGVHIELDDFGTGYASLTHVADLPINGLKIDRSFTMEMLKDRKKETVVNQLIHLARSLNISVVCEGVETQAQCERLRMMGDFSIQGYLIARPMSFDQATSWMSETAEDVYYII